MTDEPLPLWALGGGLFALFAIVLEVGASLLGQGESTSYPGFLRPIVWPTLVRVVWWLFAAAGAVMANRGLAAVTGEPRWGRTILAAIPFVAFAAAIAVNHPVATWH